MKIRQWLSFLCLLTLTGCSASSSNLQIGNTQSHLSLKDQREAVLTVVEYSALPDNAIVLGVVEAARCHRKTNVTEPTKDTVVMDLKLSAYAKGADGITNIQIEKVSGLAQNCWYILDGRATMFSLPR